MELKSISGRISREHLMGAVALVGAFALYVTWTYLNDFPGRIQNMPVYGEQNKSQAVQVKANLMTLPLVEVATEEALGDADAIDLDSIDKAFLLPEIKEMIKEEKAPDILEFFVNRFKPVVHATSAHGAFLGRNFWVIGEPISDYAFFDQNGQRILPEIVSANKNGVVLRIQDQELHLKAEPF